MKADHKGRDAECYDQGYRAGKAGEAYNPDTGNEARKAAYRDGFDQAREDKGIPRD